MPLPGVGLVVGRVRNYRLIRSKHPYSVRIPADVLFGAGSLRMRNRLRRDLSAGAPMDVITALRGGLASAHFGLATPPPSVNNDQGDYPNNPSIPPPCVDGSCSYREHANCLPKLR
jgi:hypothetical protein